jgi:hypothetical protein
MPGIVYEIKLARTAISLQPISTVRVEKKCGETRVHASIHQMVIELVKTMAYDESMQFIYVQDQVKISGLHTAKRSRRAYV